MPISDNPRDFTWGKRKRNVYLWIGVSLGIVAVLVVAGYFVFRSNPTNQNTNNNANENSNTTSGQVHRLLDGKLVDSQNANIYPVAVMIENLAVTRPQAGLSAAGVVYEALAEGGITRFLGVFATNENIKDIGPVRSARPYFVDWASEYNAMYVHVGGSPQGLQEIKDTKINDFNQFFHSGAFKISKTSNPPHHLFTDSRLLAFGAPKTNPTTGNFQTWKFDPEAPAAERPTVQKTLTIDFSTYTYQVQFAYDPATNSYLRSQGGAVFKDVNTGEQIAPKNVVVQFVSISNYDSQRLDIQTTGSGKALIFKNGGMIEGTWKKETKTSRTLYYDATGAEVTFVIGQTWVEVIEKDRQNYTYQ